jgi:hypothetical protein
MRLMTKAWTNLSSGLSDVKDYPESDREVRLLHIGAGNSNNQLKIGGESG